MTLRIVRRTLLGFIKYTIRKDAPRSRPDVALAFDVPNGPMSDRRRPYTGGMDSKTTAPAWGGEVSLLDWTVSASSIVMPGGICLRGGGPCWPVLSVHAIRRATIKRAMRPDLVLAGFVACHAFPRGTDDQISLEIALFVVEAPPANASKISSPSSCYTFSRSWGFRCYRLRQMAVIIKAPSL